MNWRTSYDNNDYSYYKLFSAGKDYFISLFLSQTDLLSPFHVIPLQLKGTEGGGGGREGASLGVPL